MDPPSQGDLSEAVPDLDLQPTSWTRAWRPFYGPVWAGMQVGSHFPLLSIPPLLNIAYTYAPSGNLNKDPGQSYSLSFSPSWGETQAISIAQVLSITSYSSWPGIWTTNPGSHRVLPMVLPTSREWPSVLQTFEHNLWSHWTCKHWLGKHSGAHSFQQTQVWPSVNVENKLTLKLLQIF